MYINQAHNVLQQRPAQKTEPTQHYCAMHKRHNGQIYNSFSLLRVMGLIFISDISYMYLISHIMHIRFYHMLP